MDTKKEIEELEKKMSEMNEQQIRMADQIRKLKEKNVQMSKENQSSGPELVCL